MMNPQSGVRTTARRRPPVAARNAQHRDANRDALRVRIPRRTHPRRVRPRRQNRAPRRSSISGLDRRRRRRHAASSSWPPPRRTPRPRTRSSTSPPSKVNLFLRVVRRREDGYHDLASLFHVIDLGDDMKFAKSTGTRDVLVCSDETIPLDSSNLVIKALDLWRRKTGSTQRFWVELVKNVPHGAGLGGGSGNAATAMWAAR